jgi:hypothetical protein
LEVATPVAENDAIAMPVGSHGVEFAAGIDEKPVPVGEQRVGILLAAADSTDGKKEPAEEWEADARLMAQPIGKSFNAETLIQCHSEDEEIRHEQGPVVIGDKQAGTFWNPLQALYHRSEIAPKEWLKERYQPTDHLGVPVLQAIGISCLYECLHARQFQVHLFW